MNKLEDEAAAAGGSIQAGELSTGGHFDPDDDLPREESEPVWSAAFSTYSKLVFEYSSRHMTNPADILNAFQGIASALSIIARTSFVQGLPENLFDVALLWIPRAKAERRLDGVAVEQKFTTSTHPTWSWAGWVGPIDFLVPYHMATPTGVDLAVFRERSFRTEMSVLGVQQHDKLAPIHRSAYFQSPHGVPPIQLLSPSPLTAILHVWAETVSASKLAKSGGTFITTDGSNMVLNPKSKAGRLWNKTPAMFNLQHALTDGKTAAAFQGFRQNAYVEYRIPRGKRYEFVLLSRVRRFPPSSTGVMDMAELALNLDRAGGEEGGPAGVRFSNGLRPWAMMNAMLVKWREGAAYAERVMVGHVHEDSWARAGPAMRYVRLG